MQNNKMLVVIIAIITIFLSACFMAAIISSDMPTWAKWLILK